MKKYLIFRTDRIGDFIFSRIITDAIKRKNANNIIDIVCSSYNAKYIKNFSEINKIYTLDKYNLFSMIINLIKINSIKYDYLIILDSKRRSFLFSILLNAKYKIALLKDWRPHLLLKLFYDKFIINSNVNSQYKNFMALANLIDLNFKNKFDYYKGYKTKKKKIVSYSNYLHLHLDEKWFQGFYYKDYTLINLNYKNFDLFIKTLFNKFKKKIIITTGKTRIPDLYKIINSHFEKNNDKKYISTTYKNNLLFFDNNTFEDLESFVKNSSILFCCEGAISHASNALDKKTYALVENFSTGKFWTDHMKKIILLKRNDIKIICDQVNHL